MDTKLKPEKKQTDRGTVRLVGLFIVAFVALSIAMPGKFLSSRNMTSILFQLPEFGLIALSLGMTMMVRGRDVSIVTCSNVLTTITCTIMLKNLTPESPPSEVYKYVVLCFGLSIIVATACGALNGFFIGILGFPSMLSTLATSSIFMGISMVMTDGRGIFGILPDSFLFLGSGKAFGVVPVPLIAFLVVFVIVYIMMHHTPFGMKMQIIGSNFKVASYSGINVRGVIFKTYVFSSLIATVQSMIVLARTNAAKPEYGSSYVLQGMLATVIAGINPNGGKGKFSNLLLAIFMLQCVDSGLNQLRINAFVRSCMYGVLLIVGIIVEFLMGRFEERALMRKALREEPAQQAA